MTNGYDPNFIDTELSIPLPGFKPSIAGSVLKRPDELREEIYSDHSHFTVVMNKQIRQPLYTAHNIHQGQFRAHVDGETGWGFDDAVGTVGLRDLYSLYTSSEFVTCVLSVFDTGLT